MELYTKTALELSSMIQKKECSCEEILNSVLSRISDCDDKLGAYITVSDKALEQARKTDKLISKGECRSIFMGIPLAVKDNISTKGIRTTCSSKILENYTPVFSATAIEKAEQAGMIILGKTNMDEFAMGSSTENSAFKLTRNPHNLSYVPGGSSGGSASAVASGEAIISLGSDTGGSVRQPSSFCGVVGIKPTYGLVSRYGLIAYASSLEQIGVIGRDVSDTSAMLGLIAGNDKRDATTVSDENFEYYKNLREDISGLKIGIPKEYFSDSINNEVRESVLNVVKALEANGAEIVELTLPHTQYAMGAYYIIASAEASSNLARYDGVKYGYRAKDCNSLEEMYVRTRSEGFGDEVKRRIMLGTFALSAGYYESYYKKSKLMQYKITEELDKALTKCDVIASPTAPSTAFRTGECSESPIKMYSNDILSVTANLAGLPAITMPCGKSSDGLPIGLQLMGKRFSEQLLLNTAKAYETIRGEFSLPLGTLKTEA